MTSLQKKAALQSEEKTLRLQGGVFAVSVHEVVCTPGNVSPGDASRLPKQIACQF
jgi:hypothetical protein